MSYGIAQYISKNENPNIFMTPVGEGVANTVKMNAESAFSNPCVKITSDLGYENYYFHAQIKRMTSNQVFKIKLINYEAPEENSQYIKTVTVEEGKTSEWVDVELIFHPALQFNTIVFELQRTEQDYTSPRYASVLFLELSKINNLISQNKLKASSLLRIGVQANPGFLMCINNEEIRVGKSRIYEIPKGEIEVVFFSAVSGYAVPAGTITSLRANADRNKIKGGYCGFSNVVALDLQRNIQPFVLDYLYKEV